MQRFRGRAPAAGGEPLRGGYRRRGLPARGLRALAACARSHRELRPAPRHGKAVGVRGIFSGRDFLAQGHAAARLHAPDREQRTAPPSRLRPATCWAVEETRFVGDPVAMVVAASVEGRRRCGGAGGDRLRAPARGAGPARERGSRGGCAGLATRRRRWHGRSPRAAHVVRVERTNNRIWAAPIETPLRNRSLRCRARDVPARHPEPGRAAHAHPDRRDAGHRRRPAAGGDSGGRWQLRDEARELPGAKRGARCGASARRAGALGVDRGPRRCSPTRTRAATTASPSSPSTRRGAYWRFAASPTAPWALTRPRWRPRAR